MIGQVRIATIFTLLAFASVPTVSAADLFENLGKTTAGSSVSYSVGLNYWNAQRFVTDGLTYDLVDVTLLMQRFSGTGAATVEIYSDSAGSPGASVATLTSPDSYTSILSNTVFLASGVTLAANSAYWVVLKGPDANTIFGWSFTNDNTGSGVGFSDVWSYSDNLGSSWNNTTGTPYQMRINAQVVPEPSSLILAGLGLTVSVIVKRRRDRIRSRGN